MASSDADIYRRLARLEAIEEIRNLKAKHMYLADSGYPVEPLADLWCDDGVMLGIFTDIDELTRGDRTPPKQFRGRDELRAFWALHAEIYSWCLHIISSPIIDIADDLLNASGQWTWAMLATRKVSAADADVWLGGTQTETYKKEHGVWKFHTLRTDLKIVAKHKDGWVPNRYLS